MIKRTVASIGAAGLVVATMLTATTASAASVTASCSNSSGAISAQVGEIITIGAPGGACLLEDASGSGVVESQALGVYLAKAVGNTTISAYTSDGLNSFTNTWSVTVANPAPTPTPTLKPKPTAKPTSTATPKPTATTSASAQSPAPSSSETPTTPTATATATPYSVPANSPQKSQKLTRSDITITSGGSSDQLAFFGPDGQPLQLLSIAGAKRGVKVVDAGINYTTRPANWQRLNYGDTCWSYVGYTDVQGFVLPVATPPYSTLPANWLFTAAIVATATGNVTFLNPMPGQIVDAGGRYATGLTLCAKGYANAIDRATLASRTMTVKPTDKGGVQTSWVPGCSNGQATGNKHCQGASLPDYTGTLTGGGMTSSSPASTPTTAPATSRTDERVVDYCQATTDVNAPYILVRNSLVRNLPASSADAGVFSDGSKPWGSIIPAVSSSDGWPAYAGQNWTDSGRSILAAGCVVPRPITGASPVPTPTSAPARPITTTADVPTLICRATGDRDNPYRTATVAVSDIAARATSSVAYPTGGWTDILPPAPGLPRGQNWPVGKALLDSGCTLTVIKPQPQKIITGTSPGLTATPGPGFTGTSFVGYAPVITVSPLPQPTFTAYTPPITVQPVPQPSFSGFSPWPPFTPVPLYSSFTGFSGFSPASLVPYPVPQATPTPTPTATPVPVPIPPQAGVICQGAPCLLPPTQAPGKPYTALITVASSTDPTPSKPSQPGSATDTVSFILTNGPSTVTYTTTVQKLAKLTAPAQFTMMGK